MRAVFQDDQRVGGGGVARTVAVRQFLRVTRVVKTTDSAELSDR